MKCSILMPAYNRERFIEEAIRSIQKQDESDFEILVMDDGSVDSTRRIALEMAKQDSRIKVFSQENQGISCSLNALFEASSGDFIFRLDSDDLWHEAHLSSSLLDMEKDPRFVATFSAYEIIDEHGQNPSLRRVGWGHSISGPILTHSLASQNCFGTLTSCVRRSAIDRKVPFVRQIRGSEDWDLWLRLSKIGDLKFRPQVTAQYRIHSQNETGKGLIELKQSELEILLQHCNHFEKQQEFPVHAKIRLAQRKASLMAETGRLLDAISALEISRFQRWFDLDSAIMLYKLYTATGASEKRKEIKRLIEGIQKKFKGPREACL